MSENVFTPQHKRLQPYIEYFWMMQGFGDPADKPLVAPEARFEVVLSFADATVWESTNQQLSLKGSFLCGMRKQPYTIECQGFVDYLAIRFYPHAFYQFMPFPLSEISNQFVELSSLHSHFWQHLTEKLALIPNKQQRIQQLECELVWLLEQIEKRPSSLLEQSLQTIHNHQGQLPIHTICEQFDIYPKRLEREFKKHIGVTPKFYSRVVRFNHALSAIQQQSNLQWMDLVYDFGYFDQAHFIKEFNSFLGQSPYSYLTSLSES